MWEMGELSRKLRITGLKCYSSIAGKWQTRLGSADLGGGGQGSKIILTRQAEGPQPQVGKLDICKTRQLIHSVYQDNIRMPSLEHGLH